MGVVAMIATSKQQTKPGGKAMTTTTTISDEAQVVINRLLAKQANAQMTLFRVSSDVERLTKNVTAAEKTVAEKRGLLTGCHPKMQATYQRQLASAENDLAVAKQELIDAEAIIACCYDVLEKRV
jgi:uncharacterized protein involved in exopolysaccharide biosynthesis